MAVAIGLAHHRHQQVAGRNAEGHQLAALFERIVLAVAHAACGIGPDFLDAPHLLVGARLDRDVDGVVDVDDLSPEGTRQFDRRALRRLLAAFHRLALTEFVVTDRLRRATTGVHEGRRGEGYSRRSRQTQNRCEQQRQSLLVVHCCCLPVPGDNGRYGFTSRKTRYVQLSKTYSALNYNENKNRSVFDLNLSPICLKFDFNFIDVDCVGARAARGDLYGQANATTETARRAIAGRAVR